MMLAGGVQMRSKRTTMTPFVTPTPSATHELDLLAGHMCRLPCWRCAVVRKSSLYDLRTIFQGWALGEAGHVNQFGSAVW